MSIEKPTPKPPSNEAERQRLDRPIGGQTRSGAVKGGDAAKPGQMQGDEDKSPKDD
jgi:hypothetical protein